MSLKDKRAKYKNRIEEAKKNRNVFQAATVATGAVNQNDTAEITSKAIDTISAFYNWAANIGETDQLKQQVAQEDEKRKLLDRGASSTMNYSQDSGGVGLLSDFLTGGVQGSLTRGAIETATKQLAKAGKYVTPQATRFAQEATDFVGQVAVATPIGLTSTNYGEQSGANTFYDDSISAYAKSFALNSIVNATTMQAGSIASKFVGNKLAKRRIDNVYEDSDIKLNNKNFGVIVNRDVVGKLKDNLPKETLSKIGITKDNILDLRKLDNEEINSILSLSKNIMYLDKDNNVHLKSKEYGSAKGKKLEDGTVIFKRDESALKNRAYEHGLDGELFFKPHKIGSEEDIKARAEEATRANEDIPLEEPTSISPEKAQEYKNKPKTYTTFESIRIDEETGQPKKKDGEEFNTLEKRKILNEPTIKSIIESKPLVVKDESFKNQNIVQQAITHKVENPDKLPEDIKAVKGAMSTISLEPMKTTRSVENGKWTHNNEIYEKLYAEKTQKDGGIVYSTPKEQVVNAIKYGIVDFASNYNTSTFKPKNFYKSVAQKATKVLGIKGNNDLLIKELESITREMYPEEKLKKVDTLEDGSNIYNVKTVEPNTLEELSRKLKTVEEQKYYTKDEWEQLPEDKKIKNDFSIEGIKYESAKNEAEMSYKIDKEALDELGKFISKNKKFLEKNEPTVDLIRFVDNIGLEHTDKEVLLYWNRLNKEQQEARLDSMKKLFEDYDNLKNIYNRNKNEELHFAVKIDNNGRVYYEAYVNPKSKLGRVTFVRDNQRTKLSELSEDEILTQKSSFITFFGEKSHKMTKDEIEQTFNKYADMVIVDKNGNTRFKKGFILSEEYTDDGFMNIVVAKRFKQFVKALRDKDKGLDTKFIQVNEIDGINNGIAITKGMLAQKDKSLGLGDKPTFNEKDTYEQFAEKLNEELGELELGRSDVKTATIAVNYNASIYETTKAIARSLIDKATTSIRAKDRAEYIKKLNPYLKEMRQNAIDKFKTKLGNNEKDLAKTFELYKKLVDSLKDNKDNVNIAYESINRIKNKKPQNDLEKDIVKLLEKRAKSKLKKGESKITKDKSYTKEFEKISDELKEMYNIAQIESHIRHNSIIDNMLIERLENLFAHRNQDRVKKAYINTFGEDIVLFKDTLQNVADKGFELFANRLHEKSISIESARKYIEDIANVLGVKQEERQLLLKRAKNNMSPNEILNLVGSSGVVVSDKIMKSKLIQDITPKMETPYGTANLIAPKGYAGYDRKNRLNFKKPTPVFMFQPNYTLSQDAYIMAHSKGSAVSLWDATFGTAKEVMNFGNRANEVFSQLITGDNVGSLLKEAYINFRNEIEKSNANPKYVSDFLAEQKLLSKGRAVTREAIKKEKQKIANTDKNTHYIKLERDLKRLEETINKNRENWKDGDEINQYHNGVNDGYKIDKKQGNIVEPDRTDGIKYTQKRDFNRSYLSDVEPADETIINIKLNYKDFSNSDFGLPEFITDTSNYFVDNIVATTFENIENDKQAKVVIHELAHFVINKMKENKTESADSLINFTNELFTKGLITNKDGEPIKLNTKDSEEYIVKVVEHLLHNELMASNPSLFARKYKTRNIEKLIDEDSFYVNGEKISSLADFVNLIKDNYNNPKDLDVVIKNFNAIIRNSYIAFAKNEKVIADLNGLKLDSEVKTYSNSIKEDLDTVSKKFSNMYDKLYNKIELIPLTDIIDITTKKENLFYALSLKEGLNKEVNDITSSFKRKIVAKFASKGIDEVKDRNLGNALMVGLHNWLKEVEDSVSSKDFTERMTRISEREFEEIKEKFVDENNIDLLLSLEKAISDEALGDTVKMRRIEKAINNILNKKKTKNYNTEKAKLLDYAKRRVTYYKLNGSFKKYDIETGHITLYKNDKSNMLDKSLGRFFSDYTESQGFADMFKELVAYQHKYGINSNLLGVNPEVNIHGGSLIGIPKNSFKGNKKDVVGTVLVDKKEYYVVRREKDEYVSGRQEADIINIEPNSAIEGIYKFKIKKDKIEYFLNPSAMKTSSKNVDIKASTMLTRNFYNHLYKKNTNELALRQFKILKDAGVLIHKNDVDQRILDEYYTQLPKSHSFSKIGSQMYIPKKYAHYILGTKGFKYGKAIDNTFGKNDFSRFIKNGIKFIIEGTKVLKGTILLTHLSSYINSFVGSMVILNANTGGKGMLYVKKASKEYNEYKNMLNKYIEVVVLHGEDSNMAKAIRKKLESHKLHYAFKFGIASTIRTSAYELKTYEENFISKKITDIFNDKQAGEAFKTLTLNEETTIGNYLGNVFDKTELIPKVALYLHSLEETGSQELATKNVLMSFPTYFNLNGVLATLDDFSPFTKYMYNIPKMFLHANRNGMASTILSTSSVPMLTAITWEDDDYNNKTKEWFIEHGFAEVAEDYAYFSHNLNPYNLPVEFEKDSTLDSIFLYNIITNLDNLFDINPLTKID